jgi:nitrate/nitrite transporter NarK
MTAVAVAGIIGGPVSGWIMGRLDGAAGWAGWQWLLLLEGLPSVVIGVVVLRYLDSGPRTAPWLTEEERTILLARLEADERAKEAATSPRRTLVEVFSDPRVWLLCLVYFGLALGIYGIAFWLPQIIKETITKDNVRIGLISAIPWLVGGIAMTWNGRHADRTGERRWHTAAPALVGGLALAVSSAPAAGGWLGIAAISVATAGILSAMSAFWALPTAILSGTGAAAGIAWINSVGNLAGYASPFMVGKIRDLTHSMVVAMLMLASSLVLAALIAVLSPLGESSPPRSAKG